VTSYPTAETILGYRSDRKAKVAAVTPCSTLIILKHHPDRGGGKIAACELSRLEKVSKFEVGLRHRVTNHEPRSLSIRMRQAVREFSVADSPEPHGRTGDIDDFRRTAVRNLERAGVSRSAAMKMVGHRTESIYRRYAIVCERDLREAGEKLAGIAKVVPIRKAQAAR
jgi:hypothetical protein